MHRDVLISCCLQFAFQWNTFLYSIAANLISLGSVYSTSCFCLHLRSQTLEYILTQPTNLV